MQHKDIHNLVTDGAGRFSMSAEQLVKLKISYALSGECHHMIGKSADSASFAERVIRLIMQRSDLPGSQVKQLVFRVKP
jgi:hypothetical protein